MSRSDYIGLGGSILLHVLLALLFAFLTASKPQPQQIGYVEVEFGDFAPGRPVEAVDEETEPTQQEPEETQEVAPETTPEPEPVTDPEPEPVDVPDEEPPAEETVPETEDTETIPPQPQPEPEADEGADEQEPSEEPGDAESGDPGTGTTEQKSAPYNIEGLDRDPVFAPLPGYVEQVNTRISFRIRVAPNGRVISAIPARKGGSPDLENEVQRTLLNWKFNALPAGAPQNMQQGVVTFTFRLE